MQDADALGLNRVLHGVRIRVRFEDSRTRRIWDSLVFPEHTETVAELEAAGRRRGAAPSKPSEALTLSLDLVWKERELWYRRHRFNVRARMPDQARLEVDGRFTPRVDRRFRASVLRHGSTAYEDGMAELRELVFIPWVWLHHKLFRTVTLHAAAVELRHRAVMIVGLNGSGKSTVASSFVEEGAKVLSDNFVPISNRGEVLPFPDVARSATPPADATVLFRAHGKSAFVPPGIARLKPTPLSLCVILTRGARSSATEISPSEAARRIATMQELVPELVEGSPYSLWGGTSPWDPGHPTHRTLASRVEPVLANCRCFELSQRLGEPLPADVLKATH